MPEHHLHRIHRTIARQSLRAKIGKFWHQLGPGLTTGAADDDPSGIATYSQAGSQFGFRMLWTAVWSFPLMSVVQEMCARIGLVTGRGLAANIRQEFPRWVLYTCAFLLFAANAFNIGADLGAMAAAVQLLAPGASFIALIVGFVCLSLGLQIFVSYSRYARFLKWVALILVVYILAALSLRSIHWGEVARAFFIPGIEFSADQIILLCAIFGTTISPYLFFWQTSQEVEEQILEGQTTAADRRHEVNPAHIRAMRTDVWSGMLFSNVIMFFIMLTSAAVLYPAGIRTIATAAQAAEALRPLAGSGASLLFAVGIIGIGLLAVPVLAGSAAYALSESFRWREGLYRRLRDAYAFYGVIAVAMIVGLLMNMLGFDPIRGLVYAAVANGILAPIILFFIVRLSSNRRLMGEFASGPRTRVLGWIVTGFMGIVAVAALTLMIRSV